MIDPSLSTRSWDVKEGKSSRLVQLESTRCETGRGLVLSDPAMRARCSVDAVDCIQPA